MRRIMSVNLYKSAVVGAAVVGLAIAVVDAGVSDWSTVLLLASLRFIVEAFAFRLPVLGSGSLAFTLVFAAVLLDGPLAGAIVAAAGAVTRQDIEENKPPLTMAFNAGQLALMGICGGYLMLALGRTPLLRAAEPPPADWAWFGSSLFAAIVMTFINILLVGLAISLIRRVSLLQVWKETFRDYVISLFALALLGIVLAELIFTSGVLGMLLLVVPFAVAWQTFQVYQHQSDAYRSTVRCLVAAIEAKDPYTRGHSERVAWYARQIADDLGLDDYEVQRIEWAALLHDVGKVAVARSTLTKADTLTDEEYCKIREHPATAARILGEIDFLAESVPYVSAHHERIDGRGYPLGITEDDIPLGAKILAAADCFDAMTSQRAYRNALSFSQALTEMRSVAGKQLDVTCVDALLKRVDEDVLRRMLAGEGHAHAE